MDELYSEDFSKKNSVISFKMEETDLPFREIIPIKPVEIPYTDPHEATSLVEIYETTNQMNFHLDQLEKAIFDEFKNFSAFRFIFVKIREKLKQKMTNGIPELLEELEQLLDLS